MKRRPPKLTATSALELQDELARFWLTPTGRKFFDGWQDARAKDKPLVVQRTVHHLVR